MIDSQSNELDSFRWYPVTLRRSLYIVNYFYVPYVHLYIKTANQRHIPMKTISVHSKPYWNSELSYLSKLISDARDKYKMRATPRNRSTLEDLTIKFKTVLIESKNLWIRERLEGMNITDSTQFWKNYKKVFRNKSDNFICNLKQNDVLISADKEKEKLLFETFFT